VVYGAALEKRQWACHLVSLDTILCCPVGDANSIYIWLCHLVLGGANQYVSKMLAR